ncbi:MAG TPA: hypothetical protein DD618_05100 [Acholeplasmatales bacterium]|nr:hypothetical protein [Acholeplasmatales bacterium]
MKRRQETTIFWIIVLLVVIAALVSGVAVLISKDEYVAQAVTTATAVIGAFAIWFQMQKNKKLNEGEFIVNLNKQFIENKHIYDLFLKLEKYERKGNEENEFTDDDIANIAAYMTFFEVIYSLIERKIIKLWMIDDLFSYQFFLLLNNKHIQNLELIPCDTYYANVFRLYKIWKDYRKKNNDPIMHEESCILSRISYQLDES